MNIFNRSVLLKFFRSRCHKLLLQETNMISSSGDEDRGKADHLSVTSDNSRQDVVAVAQIKEIKNISSSVKLLKLHVPDTRFYFKAGQWVDMFIPGLETVGGFSMCSAPQLLKSERTFHLAIKYSQHPPAFWVHTKCQVGDEVSLRAGGDFFYDPPTLKDGRHRCKDLLLIAGGVGINPLYSIFLHFLSISLNRSDKHGTLQKLQTQPHKEEEEEERGICTETTKNKSNPHPGTCQMRTRSRLTMMFSARSREELLFRDEMTSLAHSNDNIELSLHCTQEKSQHDSSIVFGRITQECVDRALTKLDRNQIQVFICGPSAFIQTMEAFCHSQGIRHEDIHFEQWW